MWHPAILLPRITGRWDPDPGCSPSPVWLRLSQSSTTTSWQICQLIPSPR
jgi:hypothetical protein